MAGQEHPVACGVCLSQNRLTTILAYAVIYDAQLPLMGQDAALIPITRYGQRLPEPLATGAIGTRTIVGRPVVVAKGRARFGKGHGRGGGPLRIRCGRKHRLSLSQAAVADAFRRLGPGETLYLPEA